ncbi:hypothetical protein MMC31_006678, partial [Peltigera leucophlebia]|nr:hypothetical protein [Peltigera leucophlebia]
MGLLPLLSLLAQLSKAQGTDDGCITCAVVLGARLIPSPRHIPQETDDQSTNNNAESVNEPAIVVQIISPDHKKCKPSGAGATSCAAATAQIIWPLPVSCGDEAQASRILNEINRLAPTGRVRPIHSECGTWFFTAELSPSQIQQLMGENVGIKFIEPDVEMEVDMEISSGVRKRQSDKSYDSAGDGATIYWIDHEFYMPNPDLRGYGMAENQLMAEGISPDSPSGDHGGSMLSISGGFDHGLISLVPEREDRLRLKIVRVKPKISSFLSGIQAIITELELRTERNERVSTYTLIGTALRINQRQLGRILQLEAAMLFQTLTTKYQTVIVVSTGSSNINLLPANAWPAPIAEDPGIPRVVVSGVDFTTLFARPLKAPSSLSTPPDMPTASKSLLTAKSQAPHP